ncbi:CATRA conflict system CASPASE/TPR repeat-associated protein [Streptomyces sp. NPDC046915]|uniref:CATRA conflict system CASPASE/TPR repeat-associated protein n=1 Tax=Streptomyces sp. NPDC046915 TaxID=3155257 RepID=UPI0033FBABFF
MTQPARPPADQELVVHVFAPAQGPHADQAYQQLHAIWQRCRDGLAMINQIPETGLPTVLPTAAGTLPAGRPAAAIEDRTGEYQAIVRREHDVVNLSMVFGAVFDTPSRRLRIGSASPPGWIEFDRWWDELAALGTDALLGVVRVCQAKFADRPAPSLDASAHAVRAVLPGADHIAYWTQRGWTTEDGFAVWEASGDDEQAARRVVVLAPEEQDAELSAWTWSQGDPDMPPLARYLMHAAKLRYQARVRGDGEQLKCLVDQVNDLVGRVRSALETPTGDVRALARLRLAEADLTLAATDVRTMRRTVEITAANMTAALAEPFRTDRRLAEWLARQLDDDAEYLAAAAEKARQIGQLARHLGPADDDRTTPAPVLPPDGDGVRAPEPPPTGSHQGPRRTSPRVGFAVDVERYGSRSSPAKESVQQRLAALVREVLGDLGHRLEETDHQGTGDGMNVFLPADTEPHRALPRMIRSWQDRLAADNARFRDRMRLRLSTVVGPVGMAALGFSGSTIVEAGRLLNSAVLRNALEEHPDADFAVLVSDQLYEYVVAGGCPGPDVQRFDRRLVKVKEYRRHAWLWIPD